MRLPTVPTLPMIDHLNTTYFNKVWNAPDDHGRVNFKLNKAAERLQTGAIPVGHSVVGLPTTDKVYAVYRVSPLLFGRFINFPDNIWIKDTAVLKADNVFAFAYTAGGRSIPPGGMYFRNDPVRGGVLIAIDKRYTEKCAGASFPELYMTVYFDTTRLSRIVNQTITVTATGTTSPIAVRTIILGRLASFPASTRVYVNGWLYDATAIPALAVNDIVCLSTDPDIVGYCDLQVDDSVTGYYSTKYQQYREVLHIPKQLNAHNYIITTDTLEFAVLDLSTKKGVYGHRADPHALESITHNDVSIGRTVLQGFQNSLQAQGVFVRVYVRYATQSQSIDKDINHIEDLYTLTDAEIKKQLCGLSANQIAEWKASYLEQSAFITLLYQFKGFVGSNVLEQYTNAVGYFDVASTLAQSLHYYTYEGGEVEITKPRRLIGYPCQVLAYANGRKIPEEVIGLSNYGNGVLGLGFHTSSYVSEGSRIAVYVAEGGLKIPQRYDPTLAEPSMVVDSDDYELVKIFTYSTPQPVWKGTTTKGYHAIPLSPGDYQTSVNPNGTVTYKVTAPHYGSHFYLIPKCGLSTSAYSLDSLLANKDPIIFPLEISDNLNTVVPLIGTNAFEVYINGYRLIDGIDYTCNPVIGQHDDILQVLLEVSNLEYITVGETGNVLEVVIHGDKVVSQDKGYTISNMMYRNTPPMIWSKSCGRAFSRGLLVEDVVEKGNILISEESLTPGSPYLLEWNIPYSVWKLMANISVNSDINLRARIAAVLKLTAPTYPDTVSITDQYTLYSPYLAKIVSDVAAGSLVIADDPHDDLFLKQFDAYKLIYDRDPTVGADDPLIDRRFVTLAAHYTNFDIQDPGQMILVHRLISLLLTPAKLSISEVLL